MLGHLASERMQAARRGVALGKRTRARTQRGDTLWLPSLCFCRVLCVCRQRAKRHRACAALCERQRCHDPLPWRAMLLLCRLASELGSGAQKKVFGHAISPSALVSGTQPRSSGALQAHPVMGADMVCRRSQAGRYGGAKVCTRCSATLQQRPA